MTEIVDGDGFHLRFQKCLEDLNNKYFSISCWCTEEDISLFNNKFIDTHLLFSINVRYLSCNFHCFLNIWHFLDLPEGPISYGNYGNAQNVTEHDFSEKLFWGKFGPNTVQKLGFLEFVQNFFISFSDFCQKDGDQGCLKGSWSDFSPDIFLLNTDFRIRGNSLLPFSCYQLFSLVFI